MGAQHSHRRTKMSTCEGFSLIELSLIMTVLALFAVSMLSSRKAEQDLANASSAVSELNQIKAALTKYVDVNGALPCPARRTLVQSDANFGTATDCSINDTTGMSETTGNIVRIGMLPVRTLGLPDGLAFDPWGSRYNYAAIKALATTTTSFDSYTTAVTTGVIQVLDANNFQLTNASAKAVNAFVVYSVGPDKRGGYTAAGQQTNACNTTQKDGENCDNDAVFVDAPVNDTVAPGSASYYDDFITYSPGLWASNAP